MSLRLGLAVNSLGFGGVVGACADGAGVGVGVVVDGGGWRRGGRDGGRRRRGPLRTPHKEEGEDQQRCHEEQTSPSVRHVLGPSFLTTFHTRLNRVRMASDLRARCFRNPIMEGGETKRHLCSRLAPWKAAAAPTRRRAW